MAFKAEEYWAKRYKRQGKQTVEGDADFAAATERWRAAIVPHLPADLGAVLEFGCGVGRWAAMLAGKYTAYTGLDLCPEAITLARQSVPNGRGNFQQQPPGKPLPFADATFDTVLSITCLQHVVDDLEADRICRELGRVLKGGGLLVLSELSPTPGVAEAKHTRFREPSWYAQRIGATSQLYLGNHVNVDLNHCILVARK